MRAFSLATLVTFSFVGIACADQDYKSLKAPHITVGAKICLKETGICEDIVLTDSDMADLMHQPLTFDPLTGKATSWYYVPPSAIGCQVHGHFYVTRHLQKLGKDVGKYDLKRWVCKVGSEAPPVEKNI